jgi:hypothetical protein
MSGLRSRSINKINLRIDAFLNLKLYLIASALGAQVTNAQKTSAHPFLRERNVKIFYNILIIVSDGFQV